MPPGIASAAVDARPATGPAQQFSRLLGSRRRRSASGSIVGLEHEYAVLGGSTPGATQLDFRNLIHQLGINGRRLDPGDPNAYRCTWGGTITADDAEAEVAVPPVATRPGFSRRLLARSRAGRGEITARLPSGALLEGISTHLSVAMPARLCEWVCALYPLAFAPDLMLLMDRVSSPGLLVRPRPRRAELCGEFVDGIHLQAAAVFAVGSALACATAIERRSNAALPPYVISHIDPAVERYGWYVDRQAFGFDLYRAGRAGRLALRDGGTITAQAHLELAWTAARAALGGRADAAELELVDQIVRGDLPLACETTAGEAAAADILVGRAHRSAHGRVVARRRRPGFSVDAVVATWDFTIFAVEGDGRVLYACVPPDVLDRFLRRLDRGDLDAVLVAALAEEAAGRVLDSWAATQTPALWDAVVDARELLAFEREPEGRPTPPLLSAPGASSEDDEVVDGEEPSDGAAAQAQEIVDADTPVDQREPPHPLSVTPAGSPPHQPRRRRRRKRGPGGPRRVHHWVRRPRRRRPKKKRPHRHRHPPHRGHPHHDPPPVGPRHGKHRPAGPPEPVRPPPPVGIPVIALIVGIIGLTTALLLGGRGTTGTITVPVTPPTGQIGVTPAVVETTTTEAPRTTNPPPVVSPIQAFFERPVTTYHVDARDPDGDALTFTWTKDAANCGNFSSSDSPTGSSALWAHPDPPCPLQDVHPGTIIVVVNDGHGNQVTAVYPGGSAPGIGPPPVSSAQPSSPSPPPSTGPTSVAGPPLVGSIGADVPVDSTPTGPVGTTSSSPWPQVIAGLALLALAYGVGALASWNVAAAEGTGATGTQDGGPTPWTVPDTLGAPGGSGGPGSA